MKFSKLVFYVTLWVLKIFYLTVNGDEMLSEEELESLYKENKPPKSSKAFLVDSGDQNKTVTYVYHSVEVVDISRVSLETMDFRVDLHLKQRWVQDVEKFPGNLFPAKATSEAYLTVNAVSENPLLEKIWVPDAYIPNARVTQIASMTESHSSLTIFRNRTIIMAARLYVVLGCQMQFHWYPMDVQHCELIFESYSYPMNKVVFLWTNITTNPVLSSPDIKLLRYAVRVPLTYSEGTDDRFGRDEKFSRVTVNFIFERQIGHQLIQVFTPTFLIVALSWFSFWLGLDAIPGRVSLVVTCMLTLVTMYSGLKSDLPPVAYIKMLDIWMAGCMGFVFAAMSEFIIVKYLSWTDEKEEEKLKKSLEKMHIVKHKGADKSSYPLPLNNMFSSDARRASIMRHNRTWNESIEDIFDADDYANARKWAIRAIMKENGLLPFDSVNSIVKKRKLKWENIDKASRVAFPIVYMVFLCIFWPVLILGASAKK